MARKQGKINSLLISLDVIGFVIILAGSGLIRYAKDEAVSILGGFVLAGGVALLSITRLLSK